MKNQNSTVNTENDGMEDKKLELAMFEQKILEAIEIAEKQKKDTIILNNDGNNINLELNMVKIEKKREIYLFNEKILTIDLTKEEGSKFIYNIQGLDRVKEKLDKNPNFDYQDMGLPDLEYLKELEKDKKETKEEDSKELNNGNNQEKSKENKNNKEKDKNNDKDSKEEIAKKYNVNSNKVIHISINKKITSNDRFKDVYQMVKEKDYTDIYIIPG